MIPNCFRIIMASKYHGKYLLFIRKISLKYHNHPNYQHGDTDTVGILIVNLGTPDAPNKKALRRYLKQFLADPRVVEPPPPRWLWWLILNGVILNIRPGKSAKSYQKIWDQMGNGSPLLSIGLQQEKQLTQTLQSLYSDRIHVKLGMRYGNPSIKSALRKLEEKGARRIVVFPLYPQYSAATTASAFDAITQELQTWRWLPEMRFINHYHDHPFYIEALANSVKDHWDKHGKPDQLLISYHGVPKRYLLNGDPYHCECHVTSRLLAQSLNLQDHEYTVSFQSIFGREEWLKPYTSATLESLAKTHKHVQVICPGFSADCLETLEEIEEENREYYMDAGGKNFSYIPALNTNTDHIKALTEIIKTHLNGWDNLMGGERKNKQTQIRAKKMGADNT